MKQNKLHNYITKLIKEELDELPITRTLPGYNTTFAFSNDTTRAEDVAINSGYTIVDKNSNKQEFSTNDGYKIVKQTHPKYNLTEQQRITVLKKLLWEASHSGGVPGNAPGFDFATDSSRMADYMKMLGWEVVTTRVQPKHSEKTLTQQGFGTSTKTLPSKISAPDIKNKAKLTQTKGKALKKSPSKDKIIPSPIQETNYRNYKKDDSTSHKNKVNNSIKEINGLLHKVEIIMNQNIKLKTEASIDNDQYWDSTKRNLEKIQNRLNMLSNKFKNLI